MEKFTRIIDQYLNNELNQLEREAFEQALKTNSDLKSEYELQVKINAGAERKGLSKEVNKSIKKVKFNKTLTKAIITLATIGLITALAVGIKTKVLDKQVNHVEYEKTEEGKDNWTEADKNLTSQFFEINNAKDTIIETTGGIVFLIPANAFNKVVDKVRIEVKEALSAFEIMKAGLSTTSNGQLLETGGMFYINARNGEENLSLKADKKIEVSVPYSGKNTNMQLFDGVREKDGTINWINPKKVNRELVTTEITKLNFYPPTYLENLSNWNYNIKDKKFTDSLYYSFGFDINQSKWPQIEYKDTSANVKITTLLKGAELFDKNCKVCHFSNLRSTGPALSGCVSRAPGGEEWIKNLIRGKISSEDRYRNKLISDYGTMMTSFADLSDSELSNIIEFLKRYENEKINFKPDYTIGINPLVIKSIWDKKFNKTILATKEFEERLQVIFKTCREDILMLYVNNLDKNLYEIDSLVTKIGVEGWDEKFKEFYERKDGGVKIENNSQRALKEYLNNKMEEYSRIIKSERIKLLKEEMELNKLAENKKQVNENAKLKQANQNYEQELEINLNEAYHQLGKERPRSLLSNFVSGSISSLGWKNVDAYVINSTSNRSTLNYVEKETGKTANIKYLKLEVEVVDYSKYDRVVAYLLPNKLSSYMSMPNKSGKFNESLNELMSYNLMVIGYKGDMVFGAEHMHIEPINYKINLKQTSPKEIESKVRKFSSFEQARDLIEETNYQTFDLSYIKKQKEIVKRNELTNKVKLVIFPCSNLNEAKVDSATWKY